MFSIFISGVRLFFHLFECRVFLQLFNVMGEICFFLFDLLLFQVPAEPAPSTVFPSSFRGFSRSSPPKTAATFISCNRFCLRSHSGDSLLNLVSCASAGSGCS